MSYRFVTLKEIDEAWDEGTNSDIDKLARELLKERDAFRVVAWKRTANKMGMVHQKELEKIEAEAAELLQGEEPK